MKTLLNRWILFIMMGILPLTTFRCNEEDDAKPSTVTDVDGNVYHTCTIGTQVWMVENLKTTRFRDGTTIPLVTDGDEWVGRGALQSSAYCNYENTVANAVTYGRLYNWYAATDERNICPLGWHVPTEAEWLTLINYLAGQDQAGGKMKETGTTHWSSPNTGATNSSGFTALPGGSRQIIDGAFSGQAESGVWWSQTEIDGDMAWYHQLYFDQAGIGIAGLGKTSGYSIRCIKD